MNRYNEGKIYKLCNDVDDNIYVGSTCLPLAKRHYYHKKSARTRTSPVYNHLNEIGWDHVRIILIESYPCDNKMELEKRERHWIETLNSSLNRYIPSRTVEEYKKAGLAKQNNDKYKKTEKYREFVKRYSQAEKCKESKKQYAVIYSQSEKYKEYKKQYQQSEKYRNAAKERRQTEKYRNANKERTQTEEYKAYQKMYREKQKFHKTLSYMESTIKKCQLELPVETSIIDCKNWNLSDRISYDLN